MFRIIMLLILLFSLFSLGFPYKILVFSPTTSRSHMISNGRIADTLALAGHEVVLFEPDFMKIVHKVEPVKFAERWPVYNFSSQFADAMETFSRDVFEEETLYYYAVTFGAYSVAYNEMCRDLISRDDVMSKLRAEKFDLYIGEHQNMCGNGMAHALGIKTHFWVSSRSIGEQMSWVSGLPFTHSYVAASFGVDMGDKPTYFNRINNFAMGISFVIGMKYHNRQLNQIFRDKFGSDFPDVGSISGNSDLILISTDEFIDVNRPILPNLVHIGGLGLTDSKEQLDKVFETEMSKGELGVIYFSLGTIVNTTLIPNFALKTVLDTARKFPRYHFIVKVDKYDKFAFDYASTIPNVFITGWVSQQPVLLVGGERDHVFYEAAIAGTNTSMQTVLIYDYRITVLHNMPFFTENENGFPTFRIQCEPVYNFGEKIEFTIKLEDSKGNIVKQVANLDPYFGEVEVDVREIELNPAEVYRATRFKLSIFPNCTWSIWAHELDFQNPNRSHDIVIEAEGNEKFYVNKEYLASWSNKVKALIDADKSEEIGQLFKNINSLKAKVLLESISPCLCDSNKSWWKHVHAQAVELDMPRLKDLAAQGLVNDFHKQDRKNDMNLLLIADRCDNKEAMNMCLKAIAEKDPKDRGILMKNAESIIGKLRPKTLFKLTISATGTVVTCEEDEYDGLTNNNDGEVELTTQKFTWSTDKVLILGNRRFPVNSVYLATWSKFFDTMFFGNFREAAQNEIPISDADPETFASILEIIYTKKADAVTSDNIFDIIAMADRFDLPTVVGLCDVSLLFNDKLTLDAFLAILEIADRYRFGYLLLACFLYVEFFTTKSKFVQAYRAGQHKFSDLTTNNIMTALVQNRPQYDLRTFEYLIYKRMNNRIKYSESYEEPEKKRLRIE